ncbi:hypothetical protein H8L32_22980 [Undibacterium sp. CY18W]|uniref:Tetratricopeptide repeat-containing protein n=1 Tax=Undibacterium hunanense TaxID=2762292 RepID=A0ABR6ZWV2_9BURK|nr:hypothetical protein [Undibacterium hunanense]MBC3920346.1 hypothetical protein [Undibacterium hunanense]
MQGKILEYREAFQTGLIRSVDGDRYHFNGDDCKSLIKPRTGAEVDFETSGDKAIEIYVLTKDITQEVKNVTSLAVQATSSTYKAIIGVIKKTIPWLIGVIVVWSIGYYYTQVVVPETRRENEQREAQIAKELRDRVNTQLDGMLKEAMTICEAKDYENAILKFEEIIKLDCTGYSSCTPHGAQKMASCYIQMNKPLKALSLLNNPDVHNDELSELNIPVQNRASLYVTTAIAYSRLKEKEIAYFYAMRACKYGDCSLVEK